MAKPYSDRTIKFLENQYMPDLLDPLHFHNTLNSLVSFPQP